MSPADEEEADHLVVLLRRLKHDLGKYVTLRQRWLAPDATLTERREALADDVLRTRQGPDGTMDALGVWVPFRRVLSGELALEDGTLIDLSKDTDFVRIDEGVRAALLGTTGVALDEAFLGASQVQKGCASLLKRAMGGTLWPKS